MAEKLCDSFEDDSPPRSDTYLDHEHYWRTASDGDENPELWQSMLSESDFNAAQILKLEQKEFLVSF